MARALGVRYVLEGSVRRSGNDVRVNAQLIDGATGGYLGDWKRIFSLQDTVVRSVVDALAARNFDYAIGESGDHLSPCLGAMSKRRDARKLLVAYVS